MENEDNGDTNCVWCTWNNRQRIGKETGRVENKTICRDHPDYYIGKINQNTEKSAGDFVRELKRPNQVLINKKRTYLLAELAVPADLRFLEV